MRRGKKGRINREHVNMIKIMVRQSRILSRAVGYIKILICKHKVFKDEKNNCQCCVQLSSPFNDMTNN